MPNKNACPGCGVLWFEGTGHGVCSSCAARRAQPTQLQLPFLLGRMKGANSERGNIHMREMRAATALEL